MTDTEIEDIVMTDLVPFEDEDDGKDHLTHIISPPENNHIPVGPDGTGQDIVDIGRMNQIAIFALCGYKFVPNRNPEKYPACQKCIDIANALIKEYG